MKFIIFLIFINLSMSRATALTMSISCNLKNRPVCFKDLKGNLIGMSVDMLREAAKRSDTKLKIELVPWKRVLQGLKDGEVDGSMPLFKTKEREKYAYFLDIPLHLAVMKIFGPKDNAIKKLSTKMLYGKNIGKQRGYSISEEFDKAVKDGFIKTNKVDGVPQLIGMLKRKRIDYFVGKYSEVLYYTKKSKLPIQDYGPVGKYQKVYLAISKKSPNAERLVERLNTALKKMKEDGTLERITKKYID